VLKVKLEKTKKARQVMENLLKKLEGKHGSLMSKSLHGVLEETLRAKWLVERSRYHSGELEGPSIWRLLAKAKAIFQRKNDVYHP
jgi:hypothetical protein